MRIERAAFAIEIRWGTGKTSDSEIWENMIQKEIFAYENGPYSSKGQCKKQNGLS